MGEPRGGSNSGLFATAPATPGRGLLRETSRFPNVPRVLKFFTLRPVSTQSSNIGWNTSGCSSLEAVRHVAHSVAVSWRTSVCSSTRAVEPWCTRTQDVGTSPMSRPGVCKVHLVSICDNTVLSTQHPVLMFLSIQYSQYSVFSTQYVGVVIRSVPHGLICRQIDVQKQIDL